VNLRFDISNLKSKAVKICSVQTISRKPFQRSHDIWNLRSQIECDCHWWAPQRLNARHLVIIYPEGNFLWWSKDEDIVRAAWRHAEDSGNTIPPIANRGRLVWDSNQTPRYLNTWFASCLEHDWYMFLQTQYS
jgi:hypothetical protein